MVPFHRYVYSSVPEGGQKVAGLVQRQTEQNGSVYDDPQYSERAGQLQMRSLYRVMNIQKEPLTNETMTKEHYK